MKYIIIIILLLTGCANEELLFSAMVVGQTADYYTTQHCLDNGGKELNPIVPEDNVLLFKMGMVGTYWLLGELFPEYREPLFLFAAITGGGAAIYNMGE